MANNTRPMHPMPMLVIDDCLPEDNERLIKIATPTAPSSPKRISISRTFSLPNYGEAYKDLSGATHYSSSKCPKNFFLRSYSYPTNPSSNDKSFCLQSVSNKNYIGMNLLDPNNGIHSPGGSSSRYSLYGSFFDLSESGRHSPYYKTDNRLLTTETGLLLAFDRSSKLSTNTYQDKCNEWLNHLDAV